MEQCLKKSIEQYRGIIDHARRLEALLQDADPAALQDYTERLQQLQDEASVNDQLVFDLYSSDSEHWKRHPLFIERAGILEQIVTMNDRLLPRIRGVMAVVSDELAQIRSGRTAVAGYHRPMIGGPPAARGVG